MINHGLRLCQAIFSVRFSKLQEFSADSSSSAAHVFRDFRYISILKSRKPPMHTYIGHIQIGWNSRRKTGSERGEEVGRKVATKRLIILKVSEKGQAKRLMSQKSVSWLMTKLVGYSKFKQKKNSNWADQKPVIYLFKIKSNHYLLFLPLHAKQHQLLHNSCF